MKQYITSILVVCLSYTCFALDSIPVKKNFLGADINFFEFSFIYGFSGNTNIKYIRTFHKRFDLNATVGMTYPYIPVGIADGSNRAKDVILGKISITPCYVPLRRNNKTLQFGVGYTGEFQRGFSINGITIQLNFLKNSKKRNFTYGFNFYNDLLFYHKANIYPLYTLGMGFFIGGKF